MSECARVDCSAPATHYVTLTIPPVGWPMWRGMTVVFGLAVCRKCARSTDLSDLTTEEGMAVIERAKIAATGSNVPLDFKRAKVKPRLLNDPQWRSLMAARARAEGQA